MSILQGRIAFFIIRFDGGGGPKSTVFACDGLSQKGYDVELVVFDRSRSSYICAPLQTPVHYILSESNLKREGEFITGIRYLIYIIKYLKKCRPSIITYSGSIKCLGIVFFARLFSLRRCRFYLILRNTISETPIRYKILRRLRLVVMRFFIKHLDVITVSHGIEKEIRALGFKPKTIKTIYNPVVDMGVINRKIKKMNESFCFSKLSQKGIKLILAMGTLTPRKGFCTLLHAFAILLKSIPLLQLIIVGEGEQRSELEALIDMLRIETSVKLVGYQEQPLDWLAQADVFVLSSEEEGLPRVLIEAMACGVTPVSTDCRGGGGSEILEGGRYGYLVPVGDPEKMAQGISLALSKPLSPEFLRKRASDFSVENSIRHYVNLIEGNS